MKICFNCKSELADVDVFCSNCGKRYKTKNGIIICPMCKSKLLKNELLCEDCYKTLQISVNEIVKNIKEKEAKTKEQYDTFVERVATFDVLLKLYKDLYRYAEYLPSQINIDPKTYEEYKTIVYKSLEDIINHRIDTYFFPLRKYGDSDYVLELEIFREELIRSAKRFPDFKDVLSTDRIDNILETYK